MEQSVNALANLQNTLRTAVQAAKSLGLSDDEIIAALEDEAAELDPQWQKLKKFADADPTPWCTGCGSMTKEGCECGPIVDNN